MTSRKHRPDSEGNLGPKPISADEWDTAALLLVGRASPNLSCCHCSTVGGSLVKCGMGGSPGGSWTRFLASVPQSVGEADGNPSGYGRAGSSASLSHGTMGGL
jgi:hypothetical protein